ncbi:electron transfer flavoprotein subunit alpha/FixB family protein [Georgenia sp. TF02-10]|uniref:electron transfer flavoprotein subunit alpha/FixB family protein n=1 Tax=Georgenia sp. TF02-10 TaxID=2917725 RepID=UPI001FA6D1A6|nr:electron transfer flavoprotein subunit alpha/FixB family protein [Georgenia sp. TF02-10]UNX53955.1 electron transfer flavoprotein subunit alpha/FixB family protein [Georgenia sp. TF02-10]
MAEQLSGTVLVVADHAGSALSGPSTEVLTLARSLTAGPVAAVALTGEPDTAALGRFGAGTVYVPDLDGLSPTVAAVAAEAVLAAVAQARPEAVLLVSSFAGKEIAARLAVALGSGAIVDATGVSVADGTLVVAKTVLQGTWDTTCVVTRGVPVVAVKPTAVTAAELPDAGPAEPVAVPVEFSQAARAVRVVSRTEHPGGGRAPLSEAKVVVVGGRGVAGDFSLVEELADLLGGAVGATRVATDEGWIDHAAQIGQTGVTISPRLYVGVGVSGAIHHTAGMQSAETVVVVNNDADAPIFEMADLGVVGDATEVLPQAIAELRRRRG